MPYKINHIIKFIFLLFFCAGAMPSNAQPAGCIFKDTLLKIDFGTNNSPQEFNLRSLRNYERDFSNCPPDGYYSYSTETSNCFNGDWITLTEDHTQNDKGGKMLFVNAYDRGAADFFLASLAGFKPNTTYEIGLWMMNLCKINGGCSPLPPNIFISLSTADGKTLIALQTGLVVSSANPYWKKYSALITTPADVGTLVLKMRDITNGGCGNDFALDDITFRECYKPEPGVKQPEIKPVPKQETKPDKEVIVKKEQLRKDTLGLSKLPAAERTKAPVQVTKINSVSIQLPDVISSRENPVIKKIETPAAEMLMELYDNGQIDGDTVTIYHNNELIISHAGLSEKPIQFRIKVDAANPHHELIMVADNLGSIPPNTSLMVITAKGKRYEVFISSSETKNAKLIIDLKE